MEDHEQRNTARGADGTVRTAVVASLLTTLSTLLVVGLVTFANRDAVGKALLGISPLRVSTAESGVKAGESAVVAAVEEANPAVVSIVITKDVPVVERYFERFGPFSLLIPQYRERGTEEVEVGGGSGFIVSADGLVVTNKHVVDDPNASYVAFTSDGKRYDVEVVAEDPFFDIAIVRLETNRRFEYLEFADSDELKLGQTVIAIGNALSEFRNSVSVGVVSGLSRSVLAGSYSGETELLERVIQTDAGINPGNSGGPLLDTDGKVVGINVAVAIESENIGFALPGNIARDALRSVETQGRIVRPYLGVRTVEVTKELQAERGLGSDQGALITSSEGQSPVMQGSPAERAGLREGDIIIEVEGEEIDEDTSVAEIIRSKNVGDRVSVTVDRGGSRMTFNVVLAAVPVDF